jgi:hypothetical protein
MFSLKQRCVRRSILPVATFLLLMFPLVISGQEYVGKQRQDAVLSVCEVLEKVDGYNGKTIQVQGELIAGRHGYSLESSNCSPKLRAEWKGFPMALSLRCDASSRSSSSIKRMDALLCFLHESTARDLGVQITAVFVGTLRTDRMNPAMNLSIRPPGIKPPRGGVGPLGGYVAELAYDSVSDMVIRQVSEKEVNPQGSQRPIPDKGARGDKCRKSQGNTLKFEFPVRISLRECEASGALTLSVAPADAGVLRGCCRSALSSRGSG